MRIDDAQRFLERIRKHLTHGRLSTSRLSHKENWLLVAQGLSDQDIQSTHCSSQYDISSADALVRSNFWRIGCVIEKIRVDLNPRSSSTHNRLNDRFDCITFLRL